MTRKMRTGSKQEVSKGDGWCSGREEVRRSGKVREGNFEIRKELAEETAGGLDGGGSGA